MTDDYDHNVNVCCAGAGIRVKRHDYIVNHIIYKIHNKRRPQPVCKALKNNLKDGLKPDIIF